MADDVIPDVTMRSRAAFSGPAGMLSRPPGAPFELCGLRVWVHYLPAAGTYRPGGDWYLAVPDDPGGVTGSAAILGVGDVAGHGPTAATTMVQLRNAMLGWISAGTTDPAQLLGKLNRLCVHLGTTATAALARLDTGTGLLTWAQAGHPPPLLARGGTPVDLERPPGLLLGVVDDSTYPSRHIELAAADLMLFYTDGLIDSAEGDRWRRVDELRDQLCDISAAGRDASVAQLRDQLRHANPDDDACLMAARLLSSRANRR